MADVGRLIGILDRLVEAGNSGRILFTGPPAELVDDRRSLTAEHLGRSLR